MSKQKSAPNKALVISVAANCWKQPQDQKPGETQEIIEIGAVLFNLQTLEIEKHEDIFVKPETANITEFCTEITGITQQMLDEKQISFKDALKKLADEFKSPEIPFVTFGEWDKRYIQIQCAKTNTSYVFGLHWNFKPSFTMMMGLEKEVNIVNALKSCNMEYQGRYRRAIDDALNTSRLMAEVFKRVRNIKNV